MTGSLSDAEAFKNSVRNILADGASRDFAERLHGIFHIGHNGIRRDTAAKGGLGTGNGLGSMADRAELACVGQNRTVTGIVSRKPLLNRLLKLREVFTGSRRQTNHGIKRKLICAHAGIQIGFVDNGKSVGGLICVGMVLPMNLLFRKPLLPVQMWSVSAETNCWVALRQAL